MVTPDTAADRDGGMSPNPVARISPADDQAGRSIAVTINGERREIAAGISISELVAHIGLDPAKVAVERNREIVPRSTLQTVALADGDILEIVHFVGGG